MQLLLLQNLIQLVQIPLLLKYYYADFFIFGVKIAFNLELEWMVLIFVQKLFDF